MKIVSVEFKDTPSNDVQSPGNKLVFAKMSDGGEKVVFHFYDDELFFEADEFVGLTISEACCRVGWSPFVSVQSS